MGTRKWLGWNVLSVSTASQAWVRSLGIPASHVSGHGHCLSCENPALNQLCFTSNSMEHTVLLSNAAVLPAPLPTNDTHRRLTVLGAGLVGCLVGVLVVTGTTASSLWTSSALVVGSRASATRIAPVTQTVSQGSASTWATREPRPFRSPRPDASLGTATDPHRSVDAEPSSVWGLQTATPSATWLLLPLGMLIGGLLRAVWDRRCKGQPAPVAMLAAGATKPDETPDITLTYFDLEAAAEKVRLALVMTGTEFEDKRISFQVFCTVSCWYSHPWPIVYVASHVIFFSTVSMCNVFGVHLVRAQKKNYRT